MQDIMPQLGAGAQLIQSYGGDGFRIGNVMYNSHVLVTANATMPWNGEWTLESLAPLLANGPLEVLLAGTGARHTLLSPTFRHALKEHGIAVDSMDTGAACRTFNILLGEGRLAAVALRLPILEA